MTALPSMKMRVVPPLSETDEEQQVLNLIRRLDRLLVRTSTLQKFLSCIDEVGAEKSGVRIIQGSRVEVFCRAQGKPSMAFDWLCEQLWKQQVKSKPRQERQKHRANEAAAAATTTRPRRRSTKAVEDSCNPENDSTGLTPSAPPPPPPPPPSPPFESSDDIKNAILDYAVKQARRDPRISKAKRQYLFDNFSLIVNYGKVNAQPIHIDLQAPNHQFGLILTNNVPPTLEYQAEHGISSPADLKQHAWPDMTDTLVQALEQTESAASLLREFGDLLCPNIQPVPLKSAVMTAATATTAQPSENEARVESSKILVPTGTLLSLPGSVMHAGPAWDGFRAVLFFSGWPGGDETVQEGDTTKQEDAATNEEGETTSDSGSHPTATRTGTTASTAKMVTPPPYNPDIQYWAPLLICDLIVTVWNELCSGKGATAAAANDTNDDDRVYLLTKLADALEASSSRGKDLYSQLNDPAMQAFTKTVEQRLYQPDLTRAEFIANFVTETAARRLQPIGLGYNDEKGRHWEKISDDNLVAVWQDGKSYEVQVYRMTDSSNGGSRTLRARTVRASIFYPEDKTWEGSDDHKPYFLTMTLDPTTWFNGSNGELQDDEGKRISCFIDSKAPATPSETSPVESTTVTVRKKRKRRFAR